MKKQFFSQDSYHTDTSKYHSGLRGRFLRSRFVFFVRLIPIVFRSRRLAINGKYGWDQWAESSFDIMRLLEDSGGIVNIEGFDHIKDLKQPVVFVSNHMSTFETMVFPSLVAPFTDVTFVVKDSLVNFPLFGPIMRSRDPIVVSRNNSRDDLLLVLNKGSELLEKGTSIIIFPQSTRKPYFKTSMFNSLAVKLASRSGVMLVPIAIKTDYWKNGKFISELGPFDREKNPICIEFGEPINIEGSGKVIHQQVLDFITTRLRRWNVKIID